MIASSQNNALKVLYEKTRNHPAWQEYVRYCSDREHGLRKSAFVHLDRFIASAAQWTMEEHKAFLNVLFPLFETVEDADYAGFPHPLAQFVKPVLERWCAIETQTSDPFRWYGTYYDDDYLSKALALNQHDDRARQKLISRMVRHIHYSVHHLPEGYIGDPSEDRVLKLGGWNGVSDSRTGVSFSWNGVSFSWNGVSDSRTGVSDSRNGVSFL